MTQNKHWLVIAAVVVIVILGGWYLWSTQVTATTLANDSVFEGPYVVGAREKTVLANGAVLTVKGDLTLDGDIECSDGPLKVIVTGDAVVNRAKLRCAGDDASIALVVMGSLTLSKDSQIISEGPIQIVSDEKNLAKTPADFERLYADAATPDGKNRIGPMLEASGSTGVDGSAAAPAAGVARKTRSPKPRVMIPTAHAQGVEAVIDIAGRIVIPTPPKGNKRPLVVFNFPGVDGVRIQNLDLQGPDGLHGEGDVNQNCNSQGKDGGDAMRFLAYAGSLTVNNFTLTLGSGGIGGAGITKTDCYPQATARGGKGGKSGNFKMVAEEKFEIVGAFDIIPGWGGDGGEAVATAKDGDKPGADGGSATATGGAGAENKKTLGMNGTVGGVINVQVGSMYGGDGGDATAEAGNGVAGEGCGKKGGAGGKATATGGVGGVASVTLTGGAFRTPNAEDRGGDGGDASSAAGNGGNGGSCGPEGPGGDGGKGGDATATVGRGGTATQNGDDGDKNQEQGGNGGNGGDGCGPGGGGVGGSGDPKGTDGKPGKNACVEPPKEGGTGVVPGGGSGNQGGTGTTGSQATVEIEVIQYRGKFIATSELMIEEHSGCDDAAHWHSKPYSGGPVKATDGSTVMDPGPECGFGKTSQVPVMKIQVPK